VYEITPVTAATTRCWAKRRQFVAATLAWSGGTFWPGAKTAPRSHRDCAKLRPGTAPWPPPIPPIGWRRRQGDLVRALLDELNR